MEYLELDMMMPDDIRWQDLSFYEHEDNTSGSQTLACAAGACEVVDLVVQEPTNAVY